MKSATQNKANDKQADTKHNLGAGARGISHKAVSDVFGLANPWHGKMPAVQGKGALEGIDVHQIARQGASGPAQSYPFREKVEAGLDIDLAGIDAHIGPIASEACEQLGCAAYTMGNDVVFNGWPAESTAWHEGKHVDQQRQGVTLEGGVGEVGDVYEQEAEAAAAAATSGASAKQSVGDVEQEPAAAADSVTSGASEKEGIRDVSETSGATSVQQEYVQFEPFTSVVIGLVVGGSALWAAITAVKASTWIALAGIGFGGAFSLGSAGMAPNLTNGASDGFSTVASPTEPILSESAENTLTDAFTGFSQLLLLIKSIRTLIDHHQGKFDPETKSIIVPKPKEEDGKVFLSSLIKDAVDQEKLEGIQRRLKDKLTTYMLYTKNHTKTPERAFYWDQEDGHGHQVGGFGDTRPTGESYGTVTLTGVGGTINLNDIRTHAAKEIGGTTVEAELIKYGLTEPDMLQRSEASTCLDAGWKVIYLTKMTSAGMGYHDAHIFPGADDDDCIVTPSNFNPVPASTDPLRPALSHEVTFTWDGGTTKMKFEAAIDKPSQIEFDGATLVIPGFPTLDGKAYRWDHGKPI
jgi:hypothetical protein